MLTMNNLTLKIVATTLIMLSFSCAAAVARIQSPLTRQLQNNWRIHVATSTTTLADIVNYVGGDRVYVYSLAKPGKETTGAKICWSTNAVLRRAIVLVRLGASYDSWIEGLVADSGNAKLAADSDGDVDCSKGMTKLDSAAGAYYWLDPENAKIVAANILAGLQKASPKYGTYFQANYEKFCKKIDDRLPLWRSKLASAKGTKVLSSHSWKYLFDRFGLVEADTNAKTPALAFADGSAIALAVVDSTQSNKSLETTAKESGIRLVELPSGVGVNKIRDYFDLLDRQIDLISSALKTTGE